MKSSFLWAGRYTAGTHATGRYDNAITTLNIQPSGSNDSSSQLDSAADVRVTSAFHRIEKAATDRSAASRSSRRAAAMRAFATCWGCRAPSGRRTAAATLLSKSSSGLTLTTQSASMPTSVCRLLLRRAAAAGRSGKGAPGRARWPHHHGKVCGTCLGFSKGTAGQGWWQRRATSANHADDSELARRWVA